MSKRDINEERIMSKAFRGCCVAVLAVACGCQGAPSTTAQPAGATPAPAVHTRVVHPLPRGGVTVASIRTLPNSACALRVPGFSNAALQLFADDEGIVRIHLSHLDPTVDGGVLTLDCADDAGNTLAQTIELVVSDDVAPQKPAPFARAGKPTLALLDVDPLSLSRDELDARHYPPRPDPNASAAQYASWLQLVTSGPTLVTPHLVTDPFRVHGPVRANANGTSNNWSGYVITTPGSASEYAWIYGEWTVPRAYAEGGFGSWDHSTLWIGIDGWGTPDVVQDGTDQNTLTAFWVQTSSYDAWTEWYPYSSQTVSNFPVNPGDDIRAWTWVRDSAGNWDPRATVGWFYLWNVTENVYAYLSTGAPPGTVFNGHSAEWIMERPTVNGSLATLAQYASPAQLTGALAYDLNGVPHGYGADTSWNVTMVNPSDNHVLSRVAPVNSSTMAFTWVDHQ
jgi:hypothetical protein